MSGAIIDPQVLFLKIGSLRRIEDTDRHQTPSPHISETSLWHIQGLPCLEDTPEKGMAICANLTVQTAATTIEALKVGQKFSVAGIRADSMSAQFLLASKGAIRHMLLPIKDLTVYKIPLGRNVLGPPPPKQKLTSSF